MLKPAGLVLALLFISPATILCAREALAQPTSNTLFQMQGSNQARPWLRIATDSGTITRRVQLVDRSGLYDLSTPDGVKEPGPLLWDRISRIDEVITRRTQMRLIGAFTLGLAAAGLGNALGAPNNNGGRYALLGFGLGFQVGGWIGSQLGERHTISERSWYVAETPALINSVAASGQDTSARASGLPASAPGLDPKPVDTGEASAAALRACERIDRDRLIRVRSSLGSFEGYSGRVGPQGLEELRTRRNTANIPAPPTLMPWNTIDRVEVRAGSSLHGALVGAVGLGLFGALLGAAVGSSVSSSGGGAAVGFLLAAPVGFALGGLTGTAARRWVVIYQGP